jgi:hypothetical protein
VTTRCLHVSSYHICASKTIIKKEKKGQNSICLVARGWGGEGGGWVGKRGGGGKAVKMTQTLYAHMNKRKKFKKKQKKRREQNPGDWGRRKLSGSLCKKGLKPVHWLRVSQ